MRVGAAYTQTGVLAKGRAKGAAGEIEELGRELGLAGARPPYQGGLLAFVLVPQPVLTTSTYVVPWPQSDQFLGGDL